MTFRHNNLKNRISLFLRFRAYTGRIFPFGTMFAYILAKPNV